MLCRLSNGLSLQDEGQTRTGPLESVPLESVPLDWVCSFTSLCDTAFLSDSASKFELRDPRGRNSSTTAAADSVPVAQTTWHTDVLATETKEDGCASQSVNVNTYTRGCYQFLRTLRDLADRPSALPRGVPYRIVPALDDEDANDASTVRPMLPSYAVLYPDRRRIEYKTHSQYRCMGLEESRRGRSEFLYVGSSRDSTKRGTLYINLSQPAVLSRTDVLPADKEGVRSLVRRIEAANAAVDTRGVSLTTVIYQEPKEEGSQADHVTM